MSDLVSISAGKVGISLLQMRYTATLTCSEHSPLTASTTGQGGRRMSVTFAGTSDWSANCTIHDSTSVIGVHGVPNNVLWLIGGVLAGLLIVAFMSWRSRRQRDEEFDFDDEGMAGFDDNDETETELQPRGGRFGRQGYSPRHSVR